MELTCDSLRQRSHASTTLALLPDFELTHDGVPVAVAGREQRLLALLSITTRPMRRTKIAGMLWPDKTHERALMCVRSSLHQLHRLEVNPLIECDRGSIALSPNVHVDWDSAVHVGERVVAGEECECGDPVAMLHHPLLESWWEEWLESEQSRFTELRARALETHSRRLAASGSFARAVRAAMAAVRAEPLRESAYAALIDAQLGEGNRAEAMRTFSQLATILKDELGVPPSFALRAARD
ncbi:AfsR/SARP family transcriptional regulator [Microbacterium ulmi]|uniref:Transcriptional regulator n=1 Tax=Microbacterium ulmi TaxID=179095 RepID=A0A7Y2M075_9MICO|nr:BTAD domain-containing putative transcriptional regulator [Microbacterium ulmi]NII70658.1 DNA-binding SARP family transcriptional activator [Microbacterium ulmi]NNH04101.1 transcriptional regulator [Microbacterium ulmi]